MNKHVETSPLGNRKSKDQVPKREKEGRGVRLGRRWCPGCVSASNDLSFADGTFHLNGMPANLLEVVLHVTVVG